MDQINLEKQYKDWIISQKHPNYSLEQNNDGNLILHSDFGIAEVNFHHLEMIVVELKITLKKNDEVCFFIHFELNDIPHARELFLEMRDCLISLKDNQTTHVLLCCTAGLTTSFFAQKLTETAQVLELDYDFNAVSYTSLFEEAENYSVILLAPQIGYLEEKIRKVFTNKVIVRIPAKVFGAYDVTGAIDLVRDAVSIKKEEAKIRLAVDTPNIGEYGIYLVIVVENSEQDLRIFYQAYSECTLLDEGRIMKSRYNVNDFYDIAAVEIAKFPQIEKIYICTPGAVCDGKITFPTIGMHEFDLQKELEDRTSRDVSICNDANALARGYYQDHIDELGESFVLYYTPFMNSVGGAGIVLNGKIYTGYQNASGEVARMRHLLKFSDDPSQLRLRPDGQVELSAKYMVTIAATFAPKTIGLCNPMIFDIRTVHDAMQEYIEEQYLPDIVQVEDPTGNMIWGSILLGLEDLNNRKTKS